MPNVVMLRLENGLLSIILKVGGLGLGSVLHQHTKLQIALDEQTRTRMAQLGSMKIQ